MRKLLPNLLGLLPAGLLSAGCSLYDPIPCGDPKGPPSARYELLDAATGQSWFARSGTTPPDSVRVQQANSCEPFVSPQGYTVRVQRGSTRLLLGPDLLITCGSEVPREGGTVTTTKLLRLNARDTDTLVVETEYGPKSKGRCANVYGSPVLKIKLLYNGRLAGDYELKNANTDTLGGYFENGRGKIIKLLKRR